MSRIVTSLVTFFIAFVAVGLAVAFFDTQGSAPAAAVVRLPDGTSVFRNIDPLQSHKGQVRNLQSPLAQISAAVDAYGPQGAGIVADGMGIDIDGGVVVIVKASPGQSSSLLEDAAALGVIVESSDGDLIQMRVPVASLAALARQSGVDVVRLPLRPIAADEITGKGVAVIRADEWREAGITGLGSRIAVFDIGFEGYEALLGSELPESVTIHSCRQDGDISGEGVVHGTAVAEIVHEVAPGASLYLANFNTEVEFANCIDWFIEQGIDVVNMAVGFFASGPGDGTGEVNEMVDEATANGILWVNSAGNEARQHWQGSWNDPDTDGLLDFVDADETSYIDAREGEFIQVILKWDDAYGTSCNDYDLYLYDPTVTTIVAGSEDFQDFCSSGIDSFPAEAFSYQVPVTGRYHIAVASFVSDGLANFHLYSFNHSCPVLQYCSASGSILEPADNAGVLAVGAVEWNVTDELEPFSSQGPTEDGRVKPDIVAPDGVSSVTFGVFFGTSAAVGHVSGAAGLIKQWHPDWNAQQIGEELLSRAIDIGDPGADNASGYGLLNLGMPKPTPTPTNTATATPSPTPTPTPTPLGPPGDVNCDRTVTVLDAVLVLQFTAFLLQGLPCEAGADANGDGNVDATDVIFILWLQAGLVG